MYHVGQLLEVIRGDNKGLVLRVKEMFMGASGQQIVLQTKVGDHWTDFCREGESEVASLTKNVTRYENFYQYENDTSNSHGGPFLSLDAARRDARNSLDGDRSQRLRRVEIRNCSSNTPMPEPYGDVVEVVRRNTWLSGSRSGMKIENLRRIDDTGVVSGTTEIGDCNFHVRFIQVHEVPEENENQDGTFQEPVCDPDGLYDDAQRLNEGCLETLKLPGCDGDWVMLIYPFAR